MQFIDGFGLDKVLEHDQPAALDRAVASFKSSVEECL
jgi:hypothetical protein